MESNPFTGFFDACAGIGCFHSGIVNSIPGAGYKCVGMAEIEDHLREYYLDNFGKDIPSFGSVHLLSGTVKPKPSEVEEFERWEELKIPRGTVLTAGFPCQPFSKSGEQLGVRDGMRGTVFDSLVIMLEEKEFSGFILENVENLNGPKHREDFQAMLSVLRENYWVDYFIESPHMMDGPYALQHRRRVFILGLRKNEFNEPKEGSFLSETDRRTHLKKKECAWRVFEELPNEVDGDKAKAEYTSKGGTITIKLLQKIAKEALNIDPSEIKSMKKQELLRYLIEQKNGKYKSEMISTGSTITAIGWSEIVDLYFPDIEIFNTSPGFFTQMKSLRDKKVSYPSKNNFRALKIWNEFLQSLPIEEEPCSPVWSMEFGMKYELEDLENKGARIEKIRGLGADEKLPPYILSMFSDGKLKEVLPKWKRDFILKNREFYLKNEAHLTHWLKMIRSKKDSITNTLQKFEWQCEPSNWNQMVNHMKHTFAQLKWETDGLDKNTISERNVLCSTILVNMGIGVKLGQDILVVTLDALNFDIKRDENRAADMLLSISGKKFTIKGLRIINRLLRKQAGLDARSMEGNVVQFRPSGIRFSDSETSPALVAIGQIPYLVESLSKKGVYQLSTRQAAYLQGIDVRQGKFDNYRRMFNPEQTQLSTSEQFKRLGNAVNVELIRRIMYQFSSVAKKYCKTTNLIDAP